MSIKNDKESEHSVFWDEISNFMRELLKDAIIVGENKAKIKKDLEYWIKANF